MDHPSHNQTPNVVVLWECDHPTPQAKLGLDILAFSEEHHCRSRPPLCPPHCIQRSVSCFLAMGAPSLTQEELHPEVLPLQSALTGCNSVLQSTATAGCDGCGTVAEVATPTNAWPSAGAGIKLAVMVTCSMSLLCCFKLFLIRVPYRWNECIRLIKPCANLRI